ncbi:unnamed protein product [Moneuplotes crassus]|uniref:Uncharacterized protein n=1 Tax=Euplotes crassus TaxID=5936 RepID=A0AAD2D876_EUPCR|nr:unnamed protein product [Moneuplotes crassus]
MNLYKKINDLEATTKELSKIREHEQKEFKQKLNEFDAERAKFGTEKQSKVLELRKEVDKSNKVLTSQIDDLVRENERIRAELNDQKSKILELRSAEGEDMGAQKNDNPSGKLQGVDDFINDSKQVKSSLYNEFKIGNKNSVRSVLKSGTISFHPNMQCSSPTPRLEDHGNNYSHTLSLEHKYKSHISSPKIQNLFFEPQNSSATIGKDQNVKDIRMSRNFLAKHCNSECNALNESKAIYIPKNNQDLINTMLENNDMAPVKQSSERNPHRYSKKSLNSKIKDKVKKKGYLNISRRKSTQKLNHKDLKNQLKESTSKKPTVNSTVNTVIFNNYKKEKNPKKTLNHKISAISLRRSTLALNNNWTAEPPNVPSAKRPEILNDMRKVKKSNKKSSRLNSTLKKSSKNQNRTSELSSEVVHPSGSKVVKQNYNLSSFDSQLAGSRKPKSFLMSNLESMGLQELKRQVSPESTIKFFEP